MSTSYQWRQCSLAEIVLRIRYFIERQHQVTVYMRPQEFHLHEEFIVSRAEDAVGTFDANTPTRVIERKLLEAMLMEVS